MTKENGESEQPELELVSVPILAAGIGTRISDASKLHGSRKAAAEAARITPDSLHRYIRGAISPSFEAMAGLARPVGVSLDWLAFGEGPMLLTDRWAQRFDSAALQTAVETYLEVMAISKKVATPEQQAKLLTMIYEIVVDDEKDAVARSTAVLRLIKAVG